MEIGIEATQPIQAITEEIPVYRPRGGRHRCQHCKRKNRAVAAIVIGSGLLLASGGFAMTGISSGRPSLVADMHSVPSPVVIPVHAVTEVPDEPLPHMVKAPVPVHSTHQQHEAHLAAITPVTQWTSAPPVTPTKAPTYRTPTSPPKPSAPTIVPVKTATATPSRTATPVITTAPIAHISGIGAAMLGRALSMTGVPYVYGGDTPSGFDCSGLVYWAALQTGVSSMPRDTYEMLDQGVSSGLLVPVSTPSYGDLAFFGSGHVEFYVKPGQTFGAQSPGTVVGYHSYDAAYGYAPSAFYRVA